MQLLTAANSSTINRKSCCRKPNIGSRQGQPLTPIPSHYKNYLWTRGRGNHNGFGCNDKGPGHKDDATTNTKTYVSTYGCIG